MLRCYILFSLFLAFASAAAAGPGHDHGTAHAGAFDNSPDVPRLESVGSQLELVATAEGHTLSIYLDRIDTNEPVDYASIDVMGEDIATQRAMPLGDGVYEVEADWVDVPGGKALTFLVAVNEETDLLNGTLIVPGAAPAEVSGEVSLTALFARLETWLIAALAMAFGFFLAFAFRPVRLPPEERPAAESAQQPRLSVVEPSKLAKVVLLAASLGMLAPENVLAHGDDHEPRAGAKYDTGNVPRRLANGEVYLPKSTQRLLQIRTARTEESKANPGTELIGTVIADPSFEGLVQAPMDGEVELTEAGVSFVGRKVKKGDVLGLLAPTMPVYERGYLEQLTAEVDGKLRLAEQRLARFRGVSKDYIAQKEIEDTLAELVALREQKRVLEPKSGQKIPLVAPVDGVISVSNVRAGQVVNTRDTLFEIVDPARLWVEAIGLAGFDPDAMASATLHAGEGISVPLTYVTRAPSLRQQTLPLYFEIGAAGAAPPIGAAVKVHVQETAARRGVVLPEASVVRAPSDLWQVWEKLGPERFRPIPVQTVPLDGATVLVSGGLEAGSVVVVEGAELINQIR